MARKGNLSQYKEYLKKRYPMSYHRSKYLGDGYVVVSASDFNHVVRSINQISNALKTYEKSLINVTTGLHELSLYVESL